jgi:hypothetical protein
MGATVNETPQQICDEINAKVDRLKAEAAAERRIRCLLAKSSKQFSVKALSLMTHSRGAVVAVMGSNGKG